MATATRFNIDTSPPMKAGRLATVALAVVAVLALLGAYVGGYLWLCASQEMESSGGGSAALVWIERDYRYLWQRNIFLPAAKVESWLRGCEVRTACGPCR